MRHIPLRELGDAVGFLVLLAALSVRACCAAAERVVTYLPDVGSLPPLRPGSVTKVRVSKLFAPQEAGQGNLLIGK
jgi:hypothetical protein